MSPYNESVSVINTPFDNGFDDLWDTGDFVEGSRMPVQQRMFFILAVVSMIVVMLSLVALPDRAAVTETASNEVRAADVSQMEEAAAAERSVEEAVASAGSGGISPIFTPEVRYWESEIVDWAEAQNLDPNIVATIMQIESCGDPEAVSSAGARGLFQVMPFHFSNGENMLDPDTNAMRGLNFYNEQLRYTSNDILLSFAGYNGGYAASGGNYNNWPDETKRYHTWAKGIYEDARTGATSSETLQAWLAAGGAAGCQRAASRLNIS
jgi:soluble lytic murein transglycosylase-like protein